MPLEWRRGAFTISTDPARLDLEVIHAFLSERSYWAEGITKERVRRSIEHSLPFGLYKGEEQIGFARVITDFVAFAWLCDVFVLEDERGGGLGVWLVEVVRAHPELQELRRWFLGTKDAHGLYARFGFVPLDEPERIMRVARTERDIDAHRD